jgi:large subunit ribosomal protein L4
VVFGPRPRDYHQDIPKKLKAVARRSAFNTRALNEQVAVIERFAVEAPKTREITQLLGKIGAAESKVLILTSGISPNVYLSARNLPNVQVVPFAEASAYDVLNATQLLIEADALRVTDEEVAHA